MSGLGRNDVPSIQIHKTLLFPDEDNSRNPGHAERATHAAAAGSQQQQPDAAAHDGGCDEYERRRQLRA